MKECDPGKMVGYGGVTDGRSVCVSTASLIDIDKRLTAGWLVSAAVSRVVVSKYLGVFKTKFFKRSLRHIAQICLIYSQNIHCALVRDYVDVTVSMRTGDESNRVSIGYPIVHRCEVVLA